MILHIIKNLQDENGNKVSSIVFQGHSVGCCLSFVVEDGYEEKIEDLIKKSYEGDLGRESIDGVKILYGAGESNSCFYDLFGSIHECRDNGEELHIEYINTLK